MVDMSIPTRRVSRQVLDCTKVKKLLTISIFKKVDMHLDTLGSVAFIRDVGQLKNNNRALNLAIPDVR